MVPWPWVAVTAYVTSLAWALAGDIAGDQAVVAALKDWQTLIAGLAAVAALVYAGRQLQTERYRDRSAYLQTHTDEWEALCALEADLDRFRKSRSSDFGALLKHRSGHITLQLDIARWLRLNELCVPAIDAPLREYIQAAAVFDRFIGQVDSGTNLDLEEWEKSWIEGHLACLSDTDNALAAAISRRKQYIQALAPV